MQSCVCSCVCVCVCVDMYMYMHVFYRGVNRVCMYTHILYSLSTEWSDRSGGGYAGVSDW